MAAGLRVAVFAQQHGRRANPVGPGNRDELRGVLADRRACGALLPERVRAGSLLLEGRQERDLRDGICECLEAKGADLAPLLHAHATHDRAVAHARAFRPWAREAMPFAFRVRAR